LSVHIVFQVLGSMLGLEHLKVHVRPLVVVALRHLSTHAHGQLSPERIISPSKNVMIIILSHMRGLFGGESCPRIPCSSYTIILLEDDELASRMYLEINPRCLYAGNAYLGKHNQQNEETLCGYVLAYQHL
jgi:hypothetical protein